MELPGGFSSGAYPGQISYTTTVTVPAQFSLPVKIKLVGGVDDVLLKDGEPWPPGTDTNSPAYGYDYTWIENNRSFTLASRDTMGGNIGWSATAYFSDTNVDIELAEICPENTTPTPTPTPTNTPTPTPTNTATPTPTPTPTPNCPACQLVTDAIAATYGFPSAAAMAAGYGLPIPFYTAGNSLYTSLSACQSVNCPNTPTPTPAPTFTPTPTPVQTYSIREALQVFDEDYNAYTSGEGNGPIPPTPWGQNVKLPNNITATIKNQAGTPYTFNLTLRQDTEFYYLPAYDGVDLPPNVNVSWINSDSWDGSGGPWIFNVTSSNPAYPSLRMINWPAAQWDSVTGWKILPFTYDSSNSADYNTETLIWTFWQPYAWLNNAVSPAQTEASYLNITFTPL